VNLTRTGSKQDPSQTLISLSIDFLLLSNGGCHWWSLHLLSIQAIWIRRHCWR